MVAGAVALLVAGPLGMIGAPLAYRHFRTKTKRPRLYWFLTGVVTLPICWAPLIALVPPETPEQAAVRAKAEAERRAADLRVKKEEAKREEQRRAADLRAKKEAARKDEERKFLDWAKGVNPLIGCKTELKSQLRDPGSYQDDWAQPAPIVEKSKMTVSYIWSFRSKNGFGGYTDAAAACETIPDKSSFSSGWGGYGSPKVQIIQSQ